MYILYTIEDLAVQEANMVGMLSQKKTPVTSLLSKVLWIHKDAPAPGPSVFLLLRGWIQTYWLSLTTGKNEKVDSLHVPAVKFIGKKWLV